MKNLPACCSILSGARQQARVIRRALRLCAAALLVALPGLADVTFTSPGLTPSRMDDQGRLVEDWGTLEITVSGTALPAASAVTVQDIKLDGPIPAVQAKSQQGSVGVILSAFRAPVWPSGVDVLTVSLAESTGQETQIQLSVALPETTRLGPKTVSLGGRPIVSLPPGVEVTPAMHEWGWADEGVAMADWAKPAVQCDPAFRNIRAGIGGVPILYRFKVEPKAKVDVVLGFCESHWAQAGQRPLICQVEGAPLEEIDPVARWGQHQPGALLFAAGDANGDGTLELAVLPKPGAADQNPILNAIWLFPAGSHPNLAHVIAGKLSTAASRYVQVGGPNDQSLAAGGGVRYALTLPAHGTRELTFLVACLGGSVPQPDQTNWTLETLRASAAAVWRDWR